MKRKYMNPELDEADKKIIRNRIEFIRKGQPDAEGVRRVAPKTHGRAVYAVAEENHMDVVYLREQLGLPADEGSDDEPEEGDDEERSQKMSGLLSHWS